MPGLDSSQLPEILHRPGGFPHRDIREESEQSGADVRSPEFPVLYQGQVVAQFFLKTVSRFVVTIATRPWRVNGTRARLENSRVWMVKLDASNAEKLLSIL
jgi:hypothetical protein